SDPDGDGLTNAKEYAFGTNPMTADTGGLLDLAPDGNRLALTFFGRQSAGAGYVGLTRHYCVETTSNLTSTISWTPVTGFSDVAGEDKTISLKLPVTGTKCFFRLRAWLQ
ncbi:MAG: thrombospondin type 3 repeat-containing protein, partial [Verrucomicrobiae bacterium]